MHAPTSTRCPSRFLSLVTALVLISLVAPSRASAGAQRPCTDPAVYRDAAVNTFVLPYRFDGPSPSLELQRASRQVSALVHLELLFSILKFGAVGGTDLVSVPGSPCDVDEVIRSVSKSGGWGSLRTGQTLVVVWGRIFEQGDQLYLQTYVRFFRQGADGPIQESIKVQLTGSETSLELNARLPSQATSFPPRRISKGDLRDLDKRFRNAMVVRKEKRLDSPGKSIDFDPSRVFPYYVTQSSGDWIYIKPMMGGPEGWVLARFGEDGSDSLSLTRWMPELSYLESVAGFMRLRAQDNAAFPGTPAQVTRWISAVDGGFARYERSTTPGEATAALGLARAVQGFILWKDVSSERLKAARLCTESKQFAPDFSAARNLAAVTRPLLGGTPTLNRETVGKLSSELLSALALDPRDGVVLDNLDRLYRLFETRPALSPFPPADLASRLSTVNVARKAAAP